ncbi:hypothetical protein M7I_2595 [Glarea lozoyensis 74030]|uniref:Uncharacterized protein n=1 Tax=Glarea lozoyensis (strain ATCC 74030 / MF5533) TaxID=1104152 RepID=H0EJ71_GLAL7|nr:hypothetical protein M7I_2595 [Glarea lozoyensis 74030]
MKPLRNIDGFKRLTVQWVNVGEAVKIDEGGGPLDACFRLMTPQRMPLSKKGLYPSFLVSSRRCSYTTANRKSLAF